MASSRTGRHIGQFGSAVLPVYEQPPCPLQVYLDSGYWGWGAGDYYWVPGWVAPTDSGVLWTPPWWGWNNGAYVFNQVTGDHCRFLWRVNYGYGYTGNGYWGGRWSGNNFNTPL
ncbi:MAG: hypothetical protein Udaeo2_29050 [Candidatus Udaeobacter sp.]|nr:MAG: hypothetical protein Udaeo2_29050 [Candidatus Udaeobacter sp.]